jgi:hypothetical protein
MKRYILNCTCKITDTSTEVRSAIILNYISEIYSVKMLPRFRSFSTCINLYVPLRATNVLITTFSSLCTMTIVIDSILQCRTIFPKSLSLSLSLTHTHTRARARAHTHIYIYTHTYIYIYIYIHIHVYMYIPRK